MSSKYNDIVNESSGKLPDEISLSETSRQYHLGIANNAPSGNHHGLSGSTQNDRGDMYRMGKIQELKVRKQIILLSLD